MSSEENYEFEVHGTFIPHPSILNDGHALSHGGRDVTAHYVARNAEQVMALAREDEMHVNSIGEGVPTDKLLDSRLD